MSKMEEMAKDHSIEAFPIPWGEPQHSVNRMNAVDSFICGWKACEKEHEAVVSILKEALEFYADRKSYSLDYDTSSMVSRRVILYSDQEEINESTIFAGMRARKALAQIKKGEE
jgi:hypothetical protein